MKSDIIKLYNGTRELISMDDELPILLYIIS